MSNRPPNIAETCSYCGDSKTELRRRRIAGGSFQYAEQCTTCGRMRSTAVKASTIRHPDRLPAWDEELLTEYGKVLETARLDEREGEHAVWLIEHTAYLKTPEWRRLRAAAIARSRGLCEGCALRSPTQVHHLTYQHWKQEFLWELVAICDECHERAHADKE